MIFLIEKFKAFVKTNPKLIDYVGDNNVSWQSLYEIYSLYGEDEKIWNEYVIDKKPNIDEIIKLLKKINLDNVKNTIDGLQKVIAIIQDLSKNTNEDNYIPKRKYENLDD